MTKTWMIFVCKFAHSLVWGPCCRIRGHLHYKNYNFPYLFLHETDFCHHFGCKAPILASSCCSLPCTLKKMWRSTFDAWATSDAATSMFAMTLILHLGREADWPSVIFIDASIHWHELLSPFSLYKNKDLLPVSHVELPVVYVGCRYGDVVLPFSFWCGLHCSTVKKKWRAGSSISLASGFPLGYDLQKHWLLLPLCNTFFFTMGYWHWSHLLCLFSPWEENPLM